MNRKIIAVEDVLDYEDTDFLIWYNEMTSKDYIVYWDEENFDFLAFNKNYKFKESYLGFYQPTLDEMKFEDEETEELIKALFKFYKSCDREKEFMNYIR